MQNDINFFFGATGKGGFHSFFDKVYDEKDGWRAYIIKGGPGTGKSGLLKRVAREIGDPDTVLGPCSSDPDSLDVVVFPFRKVCLMDGTAPHVVEPKFAGMCEVIVNTGDGWDASKLHDNREPLLAACQENSAMHGTVARYLTAVGKLLLDNYYMGLSCADLSAAAAFAKRTIAKKLPRSRGRGTEQKRFLSAVTPKGNLLFSKTLEALCEEVIVIYDACGSVGNCMLEVIRAEALAAGVDVITCPCPILSEEKIEHVILPSLSLAFSVSQKPADYGTRTVHASRFCDGEALHSLRQKMRFNTKASAELIAASVDTLKQAKAVHDTMESFYIDAMDYTVVDALCEKVIKEIKAIG